jgi:ribosome-binding factor A
MRYTPKVSFYYDDGFEHALKVDKILRELGGAKLTTPSVNKK